MIDEATRIRQMNTDQIVKIKKQLGEIQRSFLTIKKSGIHRDLLIAYLKDRTALGKQTIVQVLEAQDEFYSKLAKLGDV